MKFYTSVNRYGNTILYRGYENGKRIKKRIKFEPTLYVKAGSKTEFQTLSGEYVSPIKFESMSDAKEFLKKYDGVENFTIYGNASFIPQFIAHEFPNDIQFDSSIIRIHNIDIECDSGGLGFPEPKDAKYPITAITVYDNIEKTFYSWGLGEFDTTKAKLKENIVYRKCTSEKHLLTLFINFWANEFTSPDIITGWNIRGFDIPYLVNRSYRLLGEEFTKRMSPWERIEERTVSMMKNNIQIYDLAGVIQLDYLDLFKKLGYSYGTQENYRLDTIANVVLGEGKLSFEEEETLTKLYETDHQKYIDYNQRDVWLVSRLDEKMGLIDTALAMAYKAGVNYLDVFGTTAIWDQLIHRTLLQQNIVVPPNVEKFRDDYEGAYVKIPQVGSHDWVCSFDINSLYPNIIVQLNMSPETILHGQIDSSVSIEAILSGYKSTQAVESNASVATTGQLFSNSKQGFLPKIIEGLYSERVAIKQQMLAAKGEYEVAMTKAHEYTVDELAELKLSLERTINTSENKQTALKILLNSVYGAMGNAYFRWFAMEIAEGITNSGQAIIKLAEQNVNGYMNTALKNDVIKDYVIAMDTDSVYLGLNDLVKKIYGDSHSVEQTTNFLDKVCNRIEQDVFQDTFKQFTENTNSFKNRIVIKRESISSRGIWTAKKRYILNVIDNEGVRYANPKLKIVGIEAIKSSTPAPCRDALKSLFHIIINETEQKTQDFIASFRDTFYNLPLEEKAFPRSVSDVEKFMGPNGNFVKGCPINSRAAIIYNKMLKDCDVSHKYRVITNREKIKYIYLKIQNPIRQNVIGFINVLPMEFGLHQFVDNETQFEKAFLNPAKVILDAIGWNAEPTSSLDNFFGE